MSVTATSQLRWLFTGDSITEWGRTDTANPHDIGDNYVSRLANGPLAHLTASGQLPHIEVLNSGVGGNRLSDLAARWHRDVIDLHPHLLSMYIGINDTWRRYDSGVMSPVDRFQRDLKDLLTPLADGGIAIVLVSPFVLPCPGRDRHWHEDLEPRICAIENVARHLGAIYVPLQEHMTVLGQKIGNTSVAADGVHPTPRGHDLIAQRWWAAWSERHDLYITQDFFTSDDKE